jgi:ZIP family zinc transporter
MPQLAVIVLFSWLAGVAAFVGGVVALLEGTTETEGKRELVHGVVAFGGGILVAAVAFALVPPGMVHLSPMGIAVVFSLGGIAFCVLDAAVSKQAGSRAQFMAMLMDFVPESIAMGALFAHDHRMGILLALFIGAQNLPEGFNAFRESTAGRGTPRATLISLLVVSLFGPVAGCVGYIFLQEQPVLTASIMGFAGGGVLYLVFQDIAPQSKMKRHWTPPLGAVLGFTLGMIGKQMLG